jgi:tRNA nucleotidyltransferase (CCA-adding enzyme)
MNRARLLARIRPSAGEAAALLADAEAVRARAQEALDALGHMGEASIQGSIAKGTFLRGSADIDLFLLLDPATPEAELGGIAEAVAGRILSKPRKRYAQHPYIIGDFGARSVDLVPAYRVAAARAKMSAVDRTPFHTAWVHEHLDEAARDEVRLLKAWLKGIGAYGAQTAQGGFSGYLAEVLVHLHGSLDGVVGWLAKDARPRRLAVGNDEVQDDVSPLVVVDPVDVARNCAAAVQTDTLNMAVEAARAYQAQPDERFFFPAPPRAEPAQALHEALGAQQAVWAALVLTPHTDRLDIVLPQFQRAARIVAEAAERAGFLLRRLDVHELSDEVLIQWVFADHALEATVLHRGPPVQSAQAERFEAKWSKHPQAAGPIRTRHDRLEVEVEVAHRTPHAYLAANVADLLVGKHVRLAAKDATLCTDPADVPASWAPRVADVVLERRPWQR